MGDSIVITRLVDGWEARIDGIPAAGIGNNEAEAVRSLANLLGDFVKGHKSRIDEMCDALREIADPKIPAAVKP